ncbi:hypothetical protein L1987_33786 [Smallanthus sonchifolius]|uniref:Uncharacterized protein n=1 Tax=Smallanthus sonchifolius TaxID=185202 RepID=A0ACB9HRT9_9ASTR|nr:hypothetical protein L1987_33786 [Smallanthus sonchifolius]
MKLKLNWIPISFLLLRVFFVDKDGGIRAHILSEKDKRTDLKDPEETHMEKGSYFNDNFMKLVIIKIQAAVLRLPTTNLPLQRRTSLFNLYHALGLELDLTEKGLGVRSRRFALLVDNLKVVVVNIESGGDFTVSSADHILTALPGFVEFVHMNGH